MGRGGRVLGRSIWMIAEAARGSTASLGSGGRAAVSVTGDFAITNVRVRCSVERPRNRISDGGTTLGGYSYLGLGTIVGRSHPEPGVDLTYIK